MQAGGQHIGRKERFYLASAVAKAIEIAQAHAIKLAQEGTVEVGGMLKAEGNEEHCSDGNVTDGVDGMRKAEGNEEQHIDGNGSDCVDGVFNAEGNEVQHSIGNCNECVTNEFTAASFDTAELDEWEEEWCPANPAMAPGVYGEVVAVGR